jgi:hypothetical protein
VCVCVCVCVSTKAVKHALHECAIFINSVKYALQVCVCVGCVCGCV